MDADEDVFRFNIAVDDMLSMQVAQRRRHLRNILGSLPFGEAALAAQMLVQLALAGKLEDEEHALAVVEVPKQLQDIGVAQIALDLNLATHLLLHAAACLQLVLVEDLEGADEARLALACQVDSAKLALAEGAADFEHAEVERFGHAGLLDEGQRLVFVNHDFG